MLICSPYSARTASGDSRPRSSVRAALHGGKARPLRRILCKILPQRAAGLPPRRFQRRDRRDRQIAALRLLHAKAREQPLHPPHHKGGTQFRTRHIRDGPADGKVLRRLPQSRVQVHQFHVHLLRTKGCQTQIALQQFRAVAVRQDTARGCPPPGAHGRSHPAGTHSGSCAGHCVSVPSR